MASAKQSMHHEWHTTGKISDATFKRAAQQLHMSVDDAVDALSAVSAHLNLQLVTMLVAHGVNVQAFVKWMERHHGNELLKAVLVHAQERDMLRAWSGHIAAFKARGQR